MATAVARPNRYLPRRGRRGSADQVGALIDCRQILRCAQDDAPQDDATIGMRWLIALTLLLGVATASARHGPSFSCGGKLSATEQLICADDEASSLDKFLSLSYGQLRAWLSAQEWTEVAAEQRQWLTERDRCKDTTCVVAKLKERSSALEQRRATAQKHVEAQLADKALVHAAIATGMGALRKKYEGIDETGVGPPDSQNFKCFPTGYHKFRCQIYLQFATCYDGSRTPGYAGFDVVASSSKDFKLSKVEAYEACGTPIPTRARR